MSFDVDIAVRRGAADIAVRIAPRDGLTILFGRSGIGKTSVLDMIAGLLAPDRGHVRVAGETLFRASDCPPAAIPPSSPPPADPPSGRRRVDLPPERRRAGYVFQDGRLFPHCRVRWNLLYGHRLAPAADRWMTPDEAIGFLGLRSLLDRWPATLSGGEARRVAIGRALLSGPRFLLMDEPLAALDAPRREEIMTVIERIRDELRLPILYVTHDPAEADRLGTQRVTMD